MFTLFSRKIIFPLIRLTKSFICCWYLKTRYSILKILKSYICSNTFCKNYIEYLYLNFYRRADICIFYFIKELLTYFLLFASVLKTEKQTSLYLSEHKYLICVHCNICFNFVTLCYKTLDKARLTAYSVEAVTF